MLVKLKSLLPGVQQEIDFDLFAKSGALNFHSI